MGYDITRFQGEVDDELLCPICAGVLQDPVQAQCEHAFCKGCIYEWLSRQQSCPVDRQSISPSDLNQVPRILRNMLSRLLIKCDYTHLGCSQFVKLERLEVHSLQCEFNPRGQISCDKGCGLTVLKEELKDHNCVKDLKILVIGQQHTIDVMETQLTEVRRDMALLRTSVQDCVRSLRIINPQLPALLNGQEEMLRWSNSLQRARVTRWGGMISTPDSVLQAMVRRALDDSGCPSDVAEELMENAHERRWPPGLTTLETRQLNRRNYEKYICKRIPGKQAVVVMAIDNPHMRDDMLLGPGLVMIFAHGVE